MKFNISRQELMKPTKVCDMPFLRCSCHAFIGGGIIQLTPHPEHAVDVGASIEVGLTNQSLSSMALPCYG